MRKCAHIHAHTLTLIHTLTCVVINTHVYTHIHTCTCTCTYIHHTQQLAYAHTHFMSLLWFQGHTNDVYACAWHPKKPYKFVTACDSSNVFLWNARRRQLIVSSRDNQSI
jgi:WD40 repeat protein